MSEHDAASNVARLAGLGEAKAPIPPSALIARFCADTTAIQRAVDTAANMTEAREAASRIDVGPAVAKRNEGRGFTQYHGFCGYSGGRGDDPMVTGFDDGYTFMGHLGEHGWRDLPAKGDWPYVVWMRWPASDDEPETLAEYCEADLSVWQFDSHDAARRFYASINDAP